MIFINKLQNTSQIPRYVTSIQYSRNIRHNQDYQALQNSFGDRTEFTKSIIWLWYQNYHDLKIQVKYLLNKSRRCRYSNEKNIKGTSEVRWLKSYANIPSQRKKNLRSIPLASKGKNPQVIVIFRFLKFRSISRLFYYYYQAKKSSKLDQIIKF